MFEMEQEKFIFDIKKMFLCFTPITIIQDYIDKSDVLLDFNIQKNILNNTVDNTLIKKYPIKLSYQKAFMKCIIQKLESQNEEILDDFYDKYCKILSSQDLASETHYRHFSLDNDKDALYITIQESVNMISQGTTGLCSWQAASVLSEWCIENKEKFEGKVIFELGSGVGLLGLSVIQMCSPKQYIFTDGHPKVLSMLCKNIIINLKNDPDTDNFESSDENELHLNTNKTDVHVKHLLWEDIGKWISETNITPDVILAADILFDSNIFPSLVDGLKALLSTYKIKGYVAATVRNEATIEEFLNQLDKYNVSYEDEVVSRQKIFVQKDDMTVRVIKIC